MEWTDRSSSPSQVSSHYKILSACLEWQVEKAGKDFFSLVPCLFVVCLLLPLEITLTYSNLHLGDKYSFQMSMEKTVLNNLTKTSLSLAGQDPSLPSLFYSFLIYSLLITSSDLPGVVCVPAVFE